MRGDPHQMRPRPRHHVHHRVPPTAQRDPAPLGVLVRKLVTGLLHGPLRVQRHRQMGQRILEVRVRPVLRHQHLRPEVRDQLRHHRVEGPQPPRVPRPRRQRHIHGPALTRPRRTRLLRPPRLREQRPRMLVQRDRQDPRILPESRLHPVTVVHVHIHVRDPLRPQLGSRAMASEASL
ncbi:hypothetical protein SNARM312S_03608 [Streptomyces narbonensis]